MTNKPIKTTQNLGVMVELISEEDVRREVGEAMASYMLNPTVAWAKFILTDDRKNLNGQRVPREEFSNLIRSGIHMPVKMALGEISRGHDSSKPLGVITHLKEITLDDGAHAVIALAALWGEERPADVKYIRERFNEGLDVNVSWEILYQDSSYNLEADSEDLLGTVLRAATIVGEPAYGGRTQFLSVAAKKWSDAYIKTLPDSSFLYVDGNGERLFPVADADGKVDRARLKETMVELGASNLPMNIIREKKKVLQNLVERFESGASVETVSEEFKGTNSTLTEDDKVNIEELTSALEKAQKELEVAKQELEAAQSSLEEKTTALAERDEQIATLTKEKETYETELAGLRELKEKVDAEAAIKARLDEVRTVFEEAGIEKEDEYFTQNAERLASMDKEALDFMVQELKAFAETKTTSTASKKTKIPAITGENDEKPTTSELAQYLRERKAKK